MTAWFTADTHLGHARIIKYCNRPFDSVEHMEAVMIEKFNSVLKKDDILYHLGDVSWSTYDIPRFTKALNCKNIQLILGNHDNHKLEEYRKWFSWVGEIKNITINNIQTVLFHYPMRSWLSKSHGGYHLYGHCHGNIANFDRSLDVGVDTNDFYPYSWDEIHSRLKDIPIFSDKEGGSVRGKEVSQQQKPT